MKFGVFYFSIKSELTGNGQNIRNIENAIDKTQTHKYNPYVLAKVIARRIMVGLA